MSLALPVDPRDRLDFEPTQPPAPADEVAFAFGPLGVETVRTLTVDTESMAFESCWRITEKGGSIEAFPALDPEGGFPTAMATIVHLTHSPSEHIITRKVDPWRWVFAWRIDARRVAVAEANYRVPRSEQTEADGALMRLICDAGIRAGRLNTAEAVNDHSSLPAPVDIGVADHACAESGASATAPTTAPSLAVMRAGGIPFVRPPADSHRQEERRRPAADGGSTRPAGPRWSHRMLGLAVLVVFVGMAALIGQAQRNSGALHAEASRLQVLSDTTMQQRVGDTLALGDYGEVQVELDRLSILKHFNGAVVTNSRGRAVAMAGEVRDVRMGDLVAAEVAATARPLPLAAAGSGAHLLVWDVEQAQSSGSLASSSMLVLGLGVCVVAVIAALLIARRQGRAVTQAADPPV